jgi:hypothetical protein
MITAFGRIGGHVVGFVANNSAVASGQIDVAAAYKAARFIRFCNVYNIPILFVEDTTGFLPGREQESARHRAGGPRACSTRSSTCARRASCSSCATRSAARTRRSTTTRRAPISCSRCPPRASP